MLRPFLFHGLNLAADAISFRRMANETLVVDGSLL